MKSFPDSSFFKLKTTTILPHIIIKTAITNRFKILVQYNKQEFDSTYLLNTNSFPSI